MENNNVKVYLAGGLSTNWREQVIKKTSGNFVFYNPKEHGLENLGAEFYGSWDLFHVQKCDILFGYMEETNPSGYGLSLEIGYAKALNKCIILVDERSKSDDWFKSKFAIIRNTANVNANTLEDGIKYLNSFSNDKAIVLK